MSAVVKEAARQRLRVSSRRNRTEKMIAVTDGTLIAVDTRCFRSATSAAADRQLLIPSRVVVEHLVTFVIKSSGAQLTRAIRATE